MAKFNLAFSKMLSHEGGYINDPDDLGGETYKGIARNSHGAWSGWTLIDQFKSKPNFLHSLDINPKFQNLVEQFYFKQLLDSSQYRTNPKSNFC